MDVLLRFVYGGAMNFASLPKIELHLHLDCSLSYAAVARLAPGVTREEYDRDYVAPGRCADLADFLRRAPKGFQLMQTRENLEFVVEDVLRQLEEDGVVYAELRFAPLLHLDRGLRPDEVVAAVERAAERLSRASSVQANLILCTLRHFSEAQSLATAGLVKQFAGSRVAGFDIAGDEAGFPLNAHLPAFRYAHENGLHITAHAGEGAGPESIRETLRALRPQRIGHGTRSIEDAALVAHLARERVHLELCPSANVQIIPSIRSMEEHPIDRLYRAGVSLNVNTDSRMLTPTTMTREYGHVHRVFHWTKQDFRRANEMGVAASFATPEMKRDLRQRLRDSSGPDDGPVLPA